MAFILVAIGGYFINDYWWLNYHKFFICLLVAILLVVIVNYFIVGHWWLFYWWLLMHVLLMAIEGYCWLFVILGLL